MRRNRDAEEAGNTGRTESKSSAFTHLGSLLTIGVTLSVTIAISVAIAGAVHDGHIWGEEDPEERQDGVVFSLSKEKDEQGTKVLTDFLKVAKVLNVGNVLEQDSVESGILTDFLEVAGDILVSGSELRMEESQPAEESEPACEPSTEGIGHICFSGGVFKVSENGGAYQSLIGNGTGLAGPRGATGAAGAAGATGPTGPAGPTGATGSTSPIAPRGEPGEIAHLWVSEPYILATLPQAHAIQVIGSGFEPEDEIELYFLRPDGTEAVASRLVAAKASGAFHQEYAVVFREYGLYVIEARNPEGELLATHAIFTTASSGPKSD